MIKVVNKRTHTPTPDDFLIHRGTPLGNPYTHLPLDKTKALYHVDTINEAVFKCEEYLRERLELDDIPEITDEMIRIYEHAKAGHNVNLVCFCKGTRENDICHGDAIKRIIEERLNTKPTIKLGIIGSRTATYNDNYPALVELITTEYGNMTITEIFSGGAIGADTLAEVFAKENSIKMTVFKPDWIRFGKVAGFLRNTTIIENSDEVIALWDGQSRGTLDSINKARALNKDVKIINI